MNAMWSAGKMACGVTAADKEHDFVRLVTDFITQLGLQLNVTKLIEVGATLFHCCTHFALLNCFQVDNFLSRN